MGQKISPVALRLQTNKNFQASWYSAKFYEQHLHTQLQLQTFFQQVFAQVGTKATKTHLTYVPGALNMSTFFCSPRIFDQKFAKKTIALKPTNFFQHAQTKAWPFLSDQLHWTDVKKKLMFQMLLSNKKKISTVVAMGEFFERKGGKNQSLQFYTSHLEGVSQQYVGASVKWTPWKVSSFTKSADFVAEYIAHALEVQKPVKQIFTLVQTMLKKDPNVEGFKIACSGRLQGVEMAKVETCKFGKISLHVFSSKVDYAEARALTGFGILGVKVWICYKD